MSSPPRCFATVCFLLGMLSPFAAAGDAPAGRPDAPGKGPLGRWSDYRVIMWVGNSAARHPEWYPRFFERLREMGVDTGMVHGHGDPAPYVEGGFPYYVENLVNRGLCLKWNSSVRDWDGFVTRWAKNGRPESAFRRDYCLDDPEWLGWARNEVRTLVSRHRAHAPLAYNLRDELSVTISANPFDYDFNPASLAGFRDWLRVGSNYESLEALNAAWGTAFARWEDVRPFSTDQIKRRMVTGEALPSGQPDWRAVQRIRFDPRSARQAPEKWNLAPWCDFRTYMDVSLARALDHLRGTARALDASRPVGIEGTQMPSAFGGYDLSRLSEVLGWVEPYDIGNAREIFGSFMPGKPILTTVFERETRPARRRLWHLLLEGDRGCIIWWSEDCFDWSRPDLPLTPKAQALAPVLKELHSPLARLFLRAKREFDPIILAYSQPSIQVDWLIESTRDGSTWPRRFSSFEAAHNRMARVRNAWLKALQDLGASPRFVPVELLRWLLCWPDPKVVVLPTVRALGEFEVSGLKSFLERSEAPDGGVLLADGAPADFDEHGRLRKVNPLAGDFGGLHASGEAAVAVKRGWPEGRRLRPGDVSEYGRARLAAEPDLAWARWVAAALRGVWQAPVSVPLSARVRIYRYRLGRARLLAFERGINYHMSEDLKQAGGNEALEQPIEVTARLREPGHVYDLWAGRYLGRLDRVSFRLDPWRPSLFAVLPHKAPDAGRIVQRLERTGPAEGDQRPVVTPAGSK